MIGKRSGFFTIAPPIRTLRFVILFGVNDLIIIITQSTFGWNNTTIYYWDLAIISNNNYILLTYLYIYGSSIFIIISKEIFAFISSYLSSHWNIQKQIISLNICAVRIGLYYSNFDSLFNELIIIKWLRYYEYSQR